METAKRAGIIAVIIIVSFLAIGAYAFQYTYSDDARMVRLDSWHFDDEDRLSIAVIFTDTNGYYTKANGHIDLTIKSANGLPVYSNEYDFTKGDFLTWRPMLGGNKVTGISIDIREFFSHGDYDIWMDVETKGGHNWQDLHDPFSVRRGSMWLN